MILTSAADCNLAWTQQAREVMDAMEKDSQFSQIKLLRVDGGAANNNLLMQMQADTLQVLQRPCMSATTTC